MKHVPAVIVGFVIMAAIVGAVFGVVRVFGDAAIIIGLFALGTIVASYGVGRAVVSAFFGRYGRY